MMINRDQLSINSRPDLDLIDYALFQVPVKQIFGCIRDLF